jgi:hypothetical protein
LLSWVAAVCDAVSVVDAGGSEMNSAQDLVWQKRESFGTYYFASSTERQSRGRRRSGKQHLGKRGSEMTIEGVEKTLSPQMAT